MDLKSGIDKFGLNPEDINDLLFRQRMKRILFLQRI